MQRFYVRNRTGVPVHIRLDEADGAADVFRLTLSKKRIDDGTRPLQRYVLATDMPLHLPTLDGSARYFLDDRVGFVVKQYVDAEADYRLDLDGFVN